MTNWLKKFLTRDTDLQEGDIVLTPVVNVRKRDIGEPVISFVQCVKSNPKRFNFERIDNVRMSCRRKYMITDKQTGEQWWVTTDYRMNRKLVCKELQWLTDDEANYLDTEIYDFFNKRCQRFVEIRKIRFERTQVNERKRLMGVYCK